MDGNERNERNSGNDDKSGNSANSRSSRGEPPPPAAAWLADLRAYRARLDPGEDPRQRQGPGLARSSSPAWDITGIRIRRVDKAWYDRWIALLATGERTPPHWEGFRLLRSAAEESVPPELRELLRG